MVDQIVAAFQAMPIGFYVALAAAATILMFFGDRYCCPPGPDPVPHKKKD
jgi:hypothetical protein